MFAFYLFIFSGILFGTMLGYRVWELRVGRFDIREVSARELTFSGAHLEHLNNKFLNFVRHLAHLIMVLIVRALIGVLFVIRRESRRLSTKLDHLFLEQHGFPSDNPASFFLRDIMDYKEKLRGMVPKKGEE